MPSKITPAATTTIHEKAAIAMGYHSRNLRREFEADPGGLYSYSTYIFKGQYEFLDRMFHREMKLSRVKPDDWAGSLGIWHRLRAKV